MRTFFLFLSKNRFLTKMAKKYGLRFGASKFVAGETIEEAVHVIKELNNKGLSVTIDFLGEFVDSEQEANVMADNSIHAIQAIRKERLNAQLSLKLTSMGLDISDELVLYNMRRIMDVAARNQVFVTIDMEDYARCEKILQVYKMLKSEYENIGTVLQAYLYRAEQDLNHLARHSANLRLVKGAYKESAEVAFPFKEEVDKNFKKLIAAHILNGHFTAVATHDEKIIEYMKLFVLEKQIDYDLFEFQMLYGIRSERQLELVKEGYNMRVYVPYGKDWYGYFMRRLAERPANVAFVLKGIFKR
ncbi:proline dehydrogenase family protein [Bacillus sp. FJAT-49711]|nr:proline dehydrogenase family protein [Bacillus sp. FJAT-49711]MBS4220819.1 proline dehydrogenase family protein [Bacillus sp. FJAT-49711]